MILAYLAADGIDEVGFAQAAAAVHKERVVAFGGVIGYRPGRGVGQAVAAAHHEGLEGILLFGLEIQPVILLRRGGCGGSLTRGDLHLYREAHDLLKAGGEQGIVFSLTISRLNCVVHCRQAVLLSRAVSSSSRIQRS